MYMLLKHLHVTFVLLSFLSFFIRGLWMWRQSPLLQKRPVKILPHIIDTLLLVTALMLAFHLKLTPGANPWLMAKIIALVIFIGLGLAAFKHRAPAIRKTCWILALGVFLYIVCVALTKNPLIV